MLVWLLSSVVRLSVGSWLVTELVNWALLTEPAAAFAGAAAVLAAAGAAGFAAGAAALAGAAAAGAAAVPSARTAPALSARPRASVARTILLLFMCVSLFDCKGEWRGR